MAGRQAQDFFDTLPAPLREAIIANSTAHRFRDGELLHRRGDRGRALSVVRSGAVRVSSVGADGREVTLATLQPGESFAEFTMLAQLPRQFDLCSRGDTVVDVIGHRQFDLLIATDPALSLYVIGHLARHLADALELIDDERRLPLVVRLAKLRGRLSASGPDIVITQQELADELAVSRIAVSACLRQLREQCMLTTGYGLIRVLDSAGLCDWVATHAQAYCAGVASQAPAVSAIVQ